MQKSSDEIAVEEDEFVEIVTTLLDRTPDDWFIDYTAPSGVHFLTSTWGTVISLDRTGCEAHIIKPHYTKLSELQATRLFNHVDRWEDRRLDIVSSRNIFNEEYNDPDDTQFERRLMCVGVFGMILYSIVAFLIWCLSNS